MPHTEMVTLPFIMLADDSDGYMQDSEIYFLNYILYNFRPQS